MSKLLQPSFTKAGPSGTMRKTIFLVALMILWFCYSFAQTALPYYTGFDNAAERNGWTESRYGSTQYSDWSIGAGNAPSAPNVLAHDYPVGNPGTDTVEDWMYSPPFNFQNGGKLQSIKVNVFDITGQANASDELSIYLMKLVSSSSVMVVAKLANLTQFAANNNVWHDTGNFTIPATTGTCYIAIKYKAVNDWFVPSIDNINITGNPSTGIATANTGTPLTIYPNPAGNELHVILPANTNNGAAVRLFDAAGRQVLESRLGTGTTTIDISSLASGLYFVRELFSDGTVATDKLTISH